MTNRVHLDQLRDKLDCLRQHLETAEHLDDESRHLLDEVATEIQSALNDEQPERLRTDTFVQRLVVTAREFESHHPVLSRTLESIVDLLGQVGI